MSNGPYWPRYHEPSRKLPEQPGDKQIEDGLILHYGALRIQISEVEEALASLTEAERKQADKAVVLMRTGAKMLKKILRDRGYRELKPAALRAA